MAAEPQPSHRLILELKNVGLCYFRRSSGLTWRRDKFWALKNISLQLFAGETLGVIGRNGAGKSTLLRVLAGIIRPDCGTLVNQGYQTALLSLQVGFVPHLSGRNNIILSGLLLGLSLREIKEKLESIIAFAELEEFIDQPIRTYSSGMRARLGFSTAFHIDPDVLLIDEVLGVGDAAFVKKSQEIMRQRIQSDKTVVLASHNVESIRALCDRVIWIERGSLRLQGEVEDVLNAYLDVTTRK